MRRQGDVNGDGVLTCDEIQALMASAQKEYPQVRILGLPKKHLDMTLSTWLTGGGSLPTSHRWPRS